MDPHDSSLEPGFLLEPLAYHTSVSAHQPTGSHGGFAATDGSDHLVTIPTIPFDNRNGTVASGFIWPAHIHAPQPNRSLMYQWSGSTYMSSYSLANHTMGMSIPRPSAPPPILAMQDDLRRSFPDVCDIPLPHLPPRNHGTIRFEPYHNDHPHNHCGVFLCRWDNEGSLCNDELDATPKDIFTHLRQDHGMVGNKQTYRCLWITARGRCGEQLRFQSFGRHIIKHAGIRIKCSVCDTTMPARNDLVTRHRHRHPNCSQADFIIVPGRNID